MQQKLRNLILLMLGRPGFDPKLGHVRIVVGKVALEQVFSEYFRFL
jgi:hypothetical protein